MNRIIAAVTLGASLVAISLASLALLSPRSREPASAPGKDGDHMTELRALVATLAERVDRLESSRGTEDDSREIVRDAPRREADTGGAEAEAEELEEQVAVLAKRLASLENEETIARLAESGQAVVTRRTIAAALDDVRDPELAPRDRLEAMKELRRLGKSHREQIGEAMEEHGLGEADIVLPMLDLARDTTLDVDIRTEVVRNIAGTRLPEVRPPLLDFLAFDEVPGVRASAMEALLYHLSEAEVRQAITRTSREDPDESVRGRAERYVPKVQYFERQAAGDGSGDEK